MNTTRTNYKIYNPIKITHIHRVITNSNDTVHITIQAPTAYPELDKIEPGKYPAVLQIQTRYGYGLEWIKETFNCEPDENTDVRTKR
jgi:hypothetical protein